MFNSFFWKIEIEWNHDVNSFSHSVIIFWWKKLWTIFRTLKISLKTALNACSILTKFIRPFFLNSFWFGFSNWDLTIRHFVFFWTRNSMETCYYFFFQLHLLIAHCQRISTTFTYWMKYKLCVEWTKPIIETFSKIIVSICWFFEQFNQNQSRTARVESKHVLCEKQIDFAILCANHLKDFDKKNHWISSITLKHWWNRFFQFFNSRRTARPGRIVVWHDWTDFQSFFSHRQCPIQTGFNPKIQ